MEEGNKYSGADRCRLIQSNKGRVILWIFGLTLPSGYLRLVSRKWLELVRNLMAHTQNPDFVFHLNGRVHLNRRGSLFSRLLAAEVCASALVMLDTLCSEAVWEYWLCIPFASFPFTSPPVRHRVPPHSERSIPQPWTMPLNLPSQHKLAATGSILTRPDGRSWLQQVLSALCQLTKQSKFLRIYSVYSHPQLYKTS